MEKRSWELLRQLSAKIPSVRIAIASLSGGQRQTVAIARSLVGDPKVVMLDEPTAALGVAQTAEVLNLVERLRGRGLGVVLISHNMADVQAVADRIYVLRLGKQRRGVLDRRRHHRAARRRHHRRLRQRGVATRRARGRTARPGGHHPGRPDHGRAGRMSTSLDRSDERLTVDSSPRALLDGFLRRIRSGDLGMMPVIIGLIVIWIVFYTQNSRFLSSRNLVELSLDSATIGMISIGVVLVLLLGEIDLSIGSVSGASGSILAVLLVYHGWSLPTAILAAVATGLAIGVLYGLLYTRFGVPSFVITLAGLLGFLGLQLAVLGSNGTINLPVNSWLVDFANFKFLPPVVSYVLAALAGVLYFVGRAATIRRRTAANLSAASIRSVAVRAVLITAAIAAGAYYLNLDRGIGYMPLLWILTVVVVDLMLRRTTWGRHVFAVGGNEEASRRAGIAVDRVYLSVFALCSGFAALGGVLAAARLQSVAQSSGGTDTNLMAIAAAVIGGTSLFGGRGSAYAALFGMLVLQSITSGLNLIGVEAEVRFMVTGAVLLLAVTIDSLSRQARKSSGRG